MTEDTCCGGRANVCLSLEKAETLLHRGALEMVKRVQQHTEFRYNKKIFPFFLILPH